ncbi:MAG: glycosyltransferase family 2 protein [Chthoniobacterales bacterium]
MGSGLDASRTRVPRRTNSESAAAACCIQMTAAIRGAPQIISSVGDTRPHGVTKLPHIAVCVCTYKRPELLKQLLTAVERQTTDGVFEFSVVVADNDAKMSAQATVREFGAKSQLEIEYCVEPEQNIALARNRAISAAKGEFVAFIDDDELPEPMWLQQLYDAMMRFKADGVLGPVKPYLLENVPRWAVRAGFFDRPNSRDYDSGMRLHWSQTGTGNVLLRRSSLNNGDAPFLREFGSGGEDVDFFRRSIEAGKVFVWSAEALAYEVIPAERTKLSFQLRRALLRGQGSLASPAGRPLGILKSIAACVTYAVLLPISLLCGRAIFARYLVKSCDHLGKLTARVGLPLIKQVYVLE